MRWESLVVTTGAAVAASLVVGTSRRKPRPTSDGAFELTYPLLHRYGIPFLFLAIGVASLNSWMVSNRPENALGSFVCGLVFGGLGIFALSRGVDPVRVDSETIRVPGLFATRTITWSELESVSVPRLNGELILSDQRGRKVGLSPTLSGMAEFRIRLEQILGPERVERAFAKLDATSKRWGMD